MKIFNKPLIEIKGETSLRLDCDFHSFQNSNEYYTFDDLFSIREFNKLDLEDLDSEFLYSEIGNTNSNGEVYPTCVNLEDENYLTADLVKKIKKGDIQRVNNNSILVPKVRPNLGKIIYIVDDYADIYFTKAFIEIKAKTKDIVFFYLLKTILKHNLLSVCRRGKGYPTINERDLRQIKFPKEIINAFRENDDIEAKITNLHKEVQLLFKKKNERTVNTIIDATFEKFFGYDYEEFKIKSSIKIQHNKFNAFSNNVDLRFSSKFHREAGKFVNDELMKKSIKTKKGLSISAITGKGIKPTDFVEDSQCYYITMADISSWYLDFDNLKTVSESYEKMNSEKKPKGEKISYSTKVEIGDILMMRSGEGGIGKVALVTKNINAIFSDFLIRFRFDKTKYIPKFCYYYMRTKYYQYLVEINKKGLGNNTNIFPNITNELPIPEISLKEQEKIVNEIDNELLKGKKIDEEIANIQDKILNFIKDCMTEINTTKL